MPRHQLAVRVVVGVGTGQLSTQTLVSCQINLGRILLGNCYRSVSAFYSHLVVVRREHDVASSLCCLQFLPTVVGNWHL